jgi:hypothetical protein
VALEWGEEPEDEAGAKMLGDPAETNAREDEVSAEIREDEAEVCERSALQNLLKEPDLIFARIPRAHQRGKHPWSSSSGVGKLSSI